MGNRRQLHAHFRKSHAGADVCERSYLDGLDEPLKHTVEQLNLLLIEAASRQQKQIGHAPDSVQALFRRAEVYGCFDFIDD